MSTDSPPGLLTWMIGCRHPGGGIPLSAINCRVPHHFVDLLHNSWKFLSVPGITRGQSFIYNTSHVIVPWLTPEICSLPQRKTWSGDKPLSLKPKMVSPSQFMPEPVRHVVLINFIRANLFIPTRLVSCCIWGDCMAAAAAAPSLDVLFLR